MSKTLCQLMVAEKILLECSKYTGNILNMREFKKQENVYYISFCLI